MAPKPRPGARGGAAVLVPALAALCLGAAAALTLTARWGGAGPARAAALGRGGEDLAAGGAESPASLELQAAYELLATKEAEIAQLRADVRNALDNNVQKDKLLEVRERQLTKNKATAKTIAAALAQEREDKEKLRNGVEEIVKPHIDRCNEALEAKNKAIAAMVMDKDHNAEAVLGVEGKLEAKDREADALRAEILQLKTKVQDLEEWKDEAKHERKRDDDRAKAIWEASVLETSHLRVCPKPLPHLDGVEGLGRLLVEEGLAEGAQVGGGNLAATDGLLKEWIKASSFLLVLDPADLASPPLAALTSPKVRRVEGSAEGGLVALKRQSLDLLLVGEPLREKTAALLLLSLCWDKLKPGGLLAGGFVPAGGQDELAADAADAEEVRAIVLDFAQLKKRQPTFGLRAGSSSFLLRK